MREENFILNHWNIFSPDSVANLVMKADQPSLIYSHRE